MSGKNGGVKGRLRLFPSRFLLSCKKNRTIIVHAHLYPTWARLQAYRQILL
ncbi:hypothetical protein CSPX01_03250 [Colletotrichum filicis]|nr:hypothetical protein CSPX01_03250 [Colletotrichum filicis]